MVDVDTGGGGGCSHKYMMDEGEKMNINTLDVVFPFVGEGDVWIQRTE